MAVSVAVAGAEVGAGGCVGASAGGDVGGDVGGFAIIVSKTVPSQDCLVAAPFTRLDEPQSEQSVPKSQSV